MSFFNSQRGAAIRITFSPVSLEQLGHYCSTVIKEPKIFETSSSLMCSTLAVAGLQEISLATVSDPYLWQTVPHNAPLPLVFAWPGSTTCSRSDTVLVLGLRLIKVWKLCTSRGTSCCVKKSNFSASCCEAAQANHMRGSEEQSRGTWQQQVILFSFLPFEHRRWCHMKQKLAACPKCRLEANKQLLL